MEIGRLLKIPTRPLPWWQSALLALACLALATGVRIVATPILGESVPFITFFPAVMLAAVWGGPIGGAVALLLAPMIVGFIVGAPHDRFTLPPGAVAAFLIAGALMVWLGSALAGAVRVAAGAQAQQLEAELQLRGLIGELGHRAKNGLAMMMAVTQQSARLANSVDDYRARLLDRLGAMSRSQDLVTQSAGQPLNLRDLMNTVLDPFDLGRFEIANAATELIVSPEAALGLTLVFHELATNAVKYGALSAPGGRVTITCTPNEPFSESIWTEQGGPPVRPPVSTGFGARLFQLALRGQGGETQITYDPQGVHCRVKFPAKVVAG